MVESSRVGGEVAVRPATLAEAPLLTKIQMDTLDWSELHHLGPKFLTLIHRHCITSPLALCYVAERDGAVVGYSAWTVDLKRFHRAFVLKYGILAGLVALPHLLNPRNLRPVIRGLTYARDAHPEDPPAEIFFYHVLPQGRHGGLGRALYNTMLDEVRRRGVRSLRAASITPSNEAANRFFLNLGFRCVRTERFYADTQANVYVLDLT